MPGITIAKLDRLVRDVVVVQQDYFQVPVVGYPRTDDGRSVKPPHEKRSIRVYGDPLRDPVELVLWIHLRHLNGEP